MAIAPIQKVQIVSFTGKKMDILTSLQEEGLIQIESTSKEDWGLSTALSEVSHLDHTLHRLSHALDYLSEWEEKSFGKSLFSPKPQVAIDEKERVLKTEYPSILDQVEKLERKRNDLLSQVKFLEKENEFLCSLKDLGLPVKAVEKTEKTAVQIGILPTGNMEEMQNLASQDEFWFSVIHSDKRYSHVLIIFFKEDEARMEDTLKNWNFNRLYFTDHVLDRAGEKDTVDDVMATIVQEIADKQESIKELESQGQKLAKYRPELMRVHDVLKNEREKRLSSRLLGETEKTFFLEGWIQTENIDRLKAKLEPLSENMEYYFQPPAEDEEPPVVLKNPKPWRPFEVITKLYGLPQRGFMDPTIALAPFFFVFVGLTVSEAGYGFLVGLLSFLYLKLAKPKGGLRQFLTLMTILGVATVILGTLVGGWFGFPIRPLLVLDPMKDPVSFLMLSLALGFIQVWFGTLLNMISEIKKKNFLEGIFVQGGWLILLPCLVLYGLTKIPLWGILALVGAAGIVFFGSPSRNPLARFFGGLYKLYDISRYLADVLSYSRLLALGLATSVIAMVANTLSETALGIPWVGWLLAGLIFLGMHLFNLGISFLGGFVHSMRLQFVEFFSKFYTAGSKPFKPFQLEAKYVEFTE